MSAVFLAQTMEGTNINSVGSDDNSSKSPEKVMSEWLIRAVFLTAIIGLFAPLFVHSIASLPAVSLSEGEIPIAIVAVFFGATIPALTSLLSRIVSR